jgi:hypothetical protein
MIAVGKPGRIEDLPNDLQEIEVPKGRKAVSELAREGTFSF